MYLIYLGVVVVSALILWLIQRAFTAQEHRKALDEYEAALRELRKDPENKGKRDAALVRGKTYWSVRRGGRPAREEDEAVVREQIQDIVFRGTVPAVEKGRTRIGTAKIASAPNLRRITIERLPDDTWIVPGRTKIRQLNKELGLDLANEEDGTLGALVEQKLMGAPKFGDHVVIGNLHISVTKVEDGRISKLFLKKLKG